jgi:hypothetical protein
VQHAIYLTAGAQHMDVALDLTFFEEWSKRECQAMDTDGNGAITRPEQEAYLKRIGADMCNQVKLLVARRELPLALLYSPEIELLANNRVGPAHHRLRLFFFVTTPATLRPGDEIILEDALWPQAKPLATIAVEGQDGFVLKAVDAKTPAFPPARPGEARVFKAQCQKAPAIKPSR